MRKLFNRVRELFDYYFGYDDGFWTGLLITFALYTPFGILLALLAASIVS